MHDGFDLDYIGDNPSAQRVWIHKCTYTEASILISLEV